MTTVYIYEFKQNVNFSLSEEIHDFGIFKSLVLYIYEL
jgi:hypothetical protein